MLMSVSMSVGMGVRLLLMLVWAVRMGVLMAFLIYVLVAM